MISTNRRINFATIGACALLGGCLGTAEPEFTGPSATHYAAVEGRVSSLSSSGVGFAAVGIRLPADRKPDAYYAPDVQTNPAGDYQLLAVRTGDPGPLPPADTLTVWVIAVEQVAGGGGRRDSAQLRLDFHPVAQQADPQHLDITLAVP